MKCKSIVFFICFRYEKIQEFSAPTQINTASLHPEKSIFISGGDDFKMYKFDYETGTELGNNMIRFFKALSDKQCHLITSGMQCTIFTLNIWTGVPEQTV